jgi:hypothetical protein
MDVLVGYALSIALVCTMTGIILSALLLLERRSSSSLPE